MILKKKKFYIIYTSTDDIPGYDFGDIYAYTIDKKCVENFISIRDMSKFYVKEIKLSPKEVSSLYREHLSAMLDMCDIKIHNVSDSISIALTHIEKREYINSIEVYTGVVIYTHTYANPFIFIEKYVRALVKLSYMYSFLYINNFDSVKETKNPIRPNEFNIVFDIIKHTLSKKYKTKWW